MDWVEVKVHTTTAGADAVSEQLMQEGATGTMVEDRADVPDPAKPNGFWEMIDPDLIDKMPEDVVVHAWFEPDHRYNDRMSALRDRLSQWASMDLGMDLGSLKIETQDVKEEDWAEVWKRFYKPFRAGKTLVVKPTWEHYDEQPGDKIIEIDPGMAFGSGTHETTSMCLGFLEDYMTPGARVIDVGTGSGILAIGAALLGRWGLSLLFGEAILPYAYLLVPVLGTTLCISLIYFFDVLLTIGRRLKIMTVIHLAAVALAVASSMICIPTYGMNGVVAVLYLCAGGDMLAMALAAAKMYRDKAKGTK